MEEMNASSTFAMAHYLMSLQSVHQTAFATSQIVAIAPQDMQGRIASGTFASTLGAMTPPCATHMDLALRQTSVPVNPATMVPCASSTTVLGSSQMTHRCAPHKGIAQLRTPALAPRDMMDKHVSSFIALVTFQTHHQCVRVMVPATMWMTVIVQCIQDILAQTANSSHVLDTCPT